jgi:DNA-binding response OmpR family regulator
MSIESFPWTKEVEDYKALVTDVNLKSLLSGWEVAKQIREMAAGCPIIYMTGASADQWTSHGVPDSILLRKPFAPAQLVTAVSLLLNAAGFPRPRSLPRAARRQRASAVAAVGHICLISSNERPSVGAAVGSDRIFRAPARREKGGPS